jgi:biopolymer transport protein ExbD
VELPSAATIENAETPPEKIEITIDANDHFYVNERELVKHDAETLRRTLEKIADGKADLPVIVSGDQKASLQSMMTVLDVAAQLDMVHLSFVARQSTDNDAD